MTAPRPLESELLNAAEVGIRKFTADYKQNAYEARLQLLEAVASYFGSFSLSAYNRLFQIKEIAPAQQIKAEARRIAEAIRFSGIEPPLAISALSREPLKESSKKNTGAYHTDFRLAKRVAQLAFEEEQKPQKHFKVIDPACGAGILLAALSIEAHARYKIDISSWLANSVYACDLSSMALRGARIALSSLTNDIGAIAKMWKRWQVRDSLLATEEDWRGLSPDGFDIVVANPPWEKLKLTKHEFLKSEGHDRHYGAVLSHLNEQKFENAKEKLERYISRVIKNYPEMAIGEPDLYVAFTELFLRLSKPGGKISALLPAGLIRSQGTQRIREIIFDRTDDVSISVIENRARFFEIDTRFKFLAISCKTKIGNRRARSCITLLHERGTPNGLDIYGYATLEKQELRSIRDDFSVPEVKSNKEWKIFQKISERGVFWCKSSGWMPAFCREVDMTRDKSCFIRGQRHDALPLVEGRMVQQHRFGAKGYVSGSGRRAIWETFVLGNSKIQPQHFIRSVDLSPSAKQRVSQTRVGFCDITGQTNERTMMAALIPAGVVCGNKVPTILFPDDPSEERLYVLTAILNSLPFDWMLRRVVTTTVNYFLLTSIPLPKLVRGGLPWKRLYEAAKELQKLDSHGGLKSATKKSAHLRAEIDREVAIAYGLSEHDLEIMLQDFPLLDRGQPALPNEERATITRDLILSVIAKRDAVSASIWKSRLAQASRQGANAFIHSEFSNRSYVEEMELAADAQ